MNNDLGDKRLFDLPTILTLDGRQVTGDGEEPFSGTCKDGCCDGGPSKKSGA